MYTASISGSRGGASTLGDEHEPRAVPCREILGGNTVPPGDSDEGTMRSLAHRRCHHPVGDVARTVDPGTHDPFPVSSHLSSSRPRC